MFDRDDGGASAFVPGGGNILPGGADPVDGEDVELEDSRGWLAKLNATEPLALRAFIAAAVILAISFGAPIDPAQQKAILGFASTAIVLIAMFSGRSVVWPEDSVSEVAGDMYVAGVEDAEAAIADAQDSGGPI